MHSAIAMLEFYRGEKQTRAISRIVRETATRRIVPISLRFGSTEWHREHQWLLFAFDLDKQVHREFALKDFGAPTQPAPTAGLDPVAWRQPQDGRDTVMLVTIEQAQAYAAAQVADAVAREREACAALHDRQSEQISDRIAVLNRFVQNVEGHSTWRELKFRQDWHLVSAAAIRARGNSQ